MGFRLWTPRMRGLGAVDLGGRVDRPGALHVGSSTVHDGSPGVLHWRHRHQMIYLLVLNRCSLDRRSCLDGKQSRLPRDQH